MTAQGKLSEFFQSSQPPANEFWPLSKQTSNSTPHTLRTHLIASTLLYGILVLRLSASFRNVRELELSVRTVRSP